MSLAPPNPLLAECLKAPPTTLELPAAMALRREHAHQRLRAWPELHAMLQSLRPESLPE